MSRLSELKGANLQPISKVELRPTLIVDIWGLEHSGKSHFALGAPAKRGLLYQTLEQHSVNDVATKFADRDILMAYYQSDIPAEVSRSDFEQVKGFFKRQRLAFVKDLKAAIAANASTIVWDKGSQLWEIIRYEHFGRLSKVPQHLYGPANAEFSDMVNSLPTAGINLVVINEAQPKWGDVPGTNPIERTVVGVERKGQDRMGQLVDVSIEILKKVERGKEPVFISTIRECRVNQSLIGRQYENLDFMTLALEVKPDVNPEAWL